MSVTFGQGYTVRSYSWTDWKTVQGTKNLVMQYDDDGLIYTIWGYDGPEVILCNIFKGIVPQGVDQSQNDTDKSDFENNYKSLANAPVQPKTKRDGTPAYRVTAANRTTNFKLRVFSLKTGVIPNNLHNVNPVTDADYGDMTVKYYDANGTQVTSALLAATIVKTVIDWVPAYSYEIRGGYMDIPTDVVGGVTDGWYISVIGVPDYTVQQGGSIDYISEVNIEAITTQKITSDGVAVSYLQYQAGGAPNTNKLRFIIKHPAGQQKRFQVYIEHYV